MRQPPAYRRWQDSAPATVSFRRSRRAVWHSSLPISAGRRSFVCTQHESDAREHCERGRRHEQGVAPLARPNEAGPAVEALRCRDLQDVLALPSALAVTHTERARTRLLESPERRSVDGPCGREPRIARAAGADHMILPASGPRPRQGRPLRAGLRATSTASVGRTAEPKGATRSPVPMTAITVLRVWRA